MCVLPFCYSKHNHVYGKHMLTIVCRINNIWLIQVDTKRVGIHHAQIYLHPGGLPTVPEGHHDIFYGVPKGISLKKTIMFWHCPLQSLHLHVCILRWVWKLAHETSYVLKAIMILADTETLQTSHFVNLQKRIMRMWHLCCYKHPRGNTGSIVYHFMSLTENVHLNKKTFQRMTVSLASSFEY